MRCQIVQAHVILGQLSCVVTAFGQNAQYAAQTHNDSNISKYDSYEMQDVVSYVIHCRSEGSAVGRHLECT